MKNFKKVLLSDSESNNCKTMFRELIFAINSTYYFERSQLFFKITTNNIITFIGLNETCDQTFYYR